MAEQKTISGSNTASIQQGEQTPTVSVANKQVGASGSGAVPNPERVSAASKSTTKKVPLDATVGKRKMKFYYVDKRDVELMNTSSTLATICFTLGGFSLSFWIDLTKDIALASSLTPEGVVFDEFVRPISLVFSIVSFAVGFYFLFKKGNYFKMLQEDHGEDVSYFNFGKFYSDEN